MGHIGIACVALAVMLGLLSPASAQTASWPTQPVRIIVAFPPGGATDVIGRLLAQGLTAELGHSVIVENRGGASGIIGSEILREALEAAHPEKALRLPSPPRDASR